MSVIVTAEGHVIYESQAEFRDTIETLQSENHMNEAHRWVNGEGKRIGPDEPHIDPEHNHLIIPDYFAYRNFPINTILKGAEWYRLWTYTDMERAVEFQSTEFDERFDVDEWANEHWGCENGADDPDLYVDEIMGQYDTEPPADVLD